MQSRMMKIFLLRLISPTVITEAAPITVLPTLFFYNRWQYTPDLIKPSITLINKNCVVTDHYKLGKHYFYFLNANDRLFTENETNTEIVTGTPNTTIFTKDAFHQAIIQKEKYYSIAQ